MYIILWLYYMSDDIRRVEIIIGRILSLTASKLRYLVRQKEGERESLAPGSFSL